MGRRDFARYVSEGYPIFHQPPVLSTVQNAKYFCPIIASHSIAYKSDLNELILLKILRISGDVTICVWSRKLLCYGN